MPHDFSGRNDELQKLNQLVHSDKGYAWWYADPWAGKTALAAMFSSRPPDDVDVVAYLVSRAHGEDQTYRFLHWVCDQLAALLAAKSPAQPDYAQFLSLWADACDRASRLGRPLALVIDGLDENTGDPKIASFLPAELAPSSHIVIFSRPHPGVPAEVPDGHPLRNPDTWHRLAPSSAAVAAGRQAERELGSLLREPDARTIIGLLSVGGPLSTTEIADLSGMAFSSSEPRIQLRRFDVQRVVTEKAARVLKPITDDADRYAFAHDLLREKAEAILTDEVEEHQRRIAAWADTYASANWPETTPGYLAERGLYAQWLVRIKDVGRLIELPTPGRARLLRERTGDDFLCQAELSSALDAMMSDCAANLPRACKSGHGSILNLLTYFLRLASGPGRH